jgi:hypothetical protein
VPLFVGTKRQHKLAYVPMPTTENVPEPEE